MGTERVMEKKRDEREREERENKRGKDRLERHRRYNLKALLPKYLRFVIFQAINNLSSVTKPITIYF